MEGRDKWIKTSPFPPFVAAMHRHIAAASLSFARASRTVAFSPSASKSAAGTSTAAAASLVTTTVATATKVATSAAATTTTLSLLVTSLRQLDNLARALACFSAGGDTFLLFGDVGAGKSTLTRFFLRAKTGMPTLVVNSPTFTLEHIYLHNGIKYGFFIFGGYCKIKIHFSLHYLPSFNL
jgi:hypothetical protein